MEPKAESVRGLFTRIAGRYDALNRALTFGIDVLWRRRALAMLEDSEDVLDLATGTADLAIGVARRFPAVHVTGVDLTPAMLELGRRKVESAGLTAVRRRATLVCEVVGLPDVGGESPVVARVVSEREGRLPDGIPVADRATPHVVAQHVHGELDGQSGGVHLLELVRGRLRGLGAARAEKCRCRRQCESCRIHGHCPSLCFAVSLVGF